MTDDTKGHLIAAGWAVGICFGVVLTVTIPVLLSMHLSTVIPDRCLGACGDRPVKVCEYDRIECEPTQLEPKSEEE